MAGTHYFITGTDTNVGKTWITAMLLRSLRQQNIAAVGYKPVACGDRSDALALFDASDEPTLSLDDVNPLYYKAPAAPWCAALLENDQISPDYLVSGFDRLADRYDTVLVEGAGGWEVPLTESTTMADLAQRLALPVIIVVNNKLGALNHTLLTVRNITARGMTCAGLVLNQVSDERDPASISNRMVLERYTQLPILAEIMHGEDSWPGQDFPF
jgi:dethiobiotin synthetase